MQNTSPLNAYSKWLLGWSTDAPTTYQNCGELAFQRWFKFKEAFSPVLVSAIIDMFPTPPKHILDCFAGSGTTGIVSQFLQIPSTLVEVNPFIADIIATKVENYTDVEFHVEYKFFEKSYMTTDVNLSELKKRLPPTFVEPGVNGRWLFNQNVALELEKIRLAIETIKSRKVARFFKIALASCLINISNASIDGKGRRYRKNWETRIFSSEEVFESFSHALRDMVRDVCCHDTLHKTPCTVMNCDAREAIATIQSPIDLAIFSPPYPNSFDYTDIYNIELWFLGYFSCAKDSPKLRLKTLRSHVQVKWEAPKLDIKGGCLEATVSALEKQRPYLWNKNIPEMVAAYFEDLSVIFKHIKEKLTANGKIAIVIGDSSYGGICIDTATILEEIACTLDLKLELRKSERVMRSSIQNRNSKHPLNEWLLIFRKIACV
ncbi:MAG: hypothetical protein QM579_06555 [Desulfovibrio sp.]|uniref:hypothetical protein n=1 Tax=Desulfovibrio sp. TaxID=885 RepID=UPI0039E35734